MANRVAGHVQVEIQPSPKLVRLVESLQLNDAETFQAVEHYVNPLLEKGADTIILGCTHFAHLTPVIEKVAGANVSVISTELPVAKEVVRRLETSNLLTDANTSGNVTFFSNHNEQLFEKQVSRLWGEDAKTESF